MICDSHKLCNSPLVLGGLGWPAGCPACAGLGWPGQGWLLGHSYAALYSRIIPCKKCHRIPQSRKFLIHRCCWASLLAGQLAARPILAWVDPGRADFWVTHMLLYINELFQLVCLFVCFQHGKIKRRRIPWSRKLVSYWLRPSLPVTRFFFFLFYNFSITLS